MLWIRSVSAYRNLGSPGASSRYRWAGQASQATRRGTPYGRWTAINHYSPGRPNLPAVGVWRGLSGHCGGRPHAHGPLLPPSVLPTRPLAPVDLGNLIRRPPSSPLSKPPGWCLVFQSTAAIPNARAQINQQAINKASLPFACLCLAILRPCRLPGRDEREPSSTSRHSYRVTYYDRCLQAL